MGDTLLYLSRRDLESLGIAMGEIVEAVDAACRAKGEGDVLMPPKLSLHRGDGAFSQAMAAWSPKGGQLGVKWVTVFPDNQTAGLPLVGGLVVLSDPRDGRPLAVMDAGVVTAWRTGASVGVAARYLARADVDCIAVVGCGVQGRSSVRALAAVLPELRAVRCYDTAPAAVVGLVDELQQELPDLEFAACLGPTEPARSAGVVITAITMSDKRRPSLGPGLLEPGALAVALDYDAAWSGPAMAACTRFYCDDRATVLAVKAGGDRLEDIPEEIAADLGDLAAGRAKGRQTVDERLFCMNLGMAVEDIAAGALALERARELGAGRELPL